MMDQISSDMFPWMQPKQRQSPPVEVPVTPAPTPEPVSEPEPVAVAEPPPVQRAYEPELHEQVQHTHQ